MATMSEEEFAALQILLKASSKDVVRQLCQDCFSSSLSGSDKLIETTCSSLSVAPNEANQLICSLGNLTRYIVYQGLTSPEEILPLFPEGFHQNLKNLLTKIILENISAWRNEAQARQISLPRLVDMDWRVDIKTSSDTISRMAVPTCLLQLKASEALCRLQNLLDQALRQDEKMKYNGCVGFPLNLWGKNIIQEDPSLCGNDVATSALTVELNKQTLDTMLDGLGRIRDQLSAVANK